MVIFNSKVLNYQRVDYLSNGGLSEFLNMKQFLFSSSLFFFIVAGNISQHVFIWARVTVAENYVGQG